MEELLAPRAEGGYELDLRGHAVETCWVNYSFSLVLFAPRDGSTSKPDGRLDFRTPFECRVDGSSYLLDPGQDLVELGHALLVLRQTVEDAYTDSDGGLTLTFADQAMIRAPSHPHHESWQFVRDDGLRIICMPGGELAGWGPRSPRQDRGMTKEIVNPRSLAKPVGFNHGIVTSGGRLLFLAGQDASDASGQIVAPGDVVGQLHQVLLNLKTVVEAAGGTMENIVKLNIYVRDRDDYVARRKALGRVFRKQFGHYYPTMALFEVARLFQDDALIEMEGIAVLT